MTAVFSRTVRPAYLKNRELYDKMILALAESVQGIPVIKGFARERQASVRFHESNLKVHDHNLWIFGRVSRFVPSIGFVTQVNLVILLAYGGYLVIQGSLPLGAGLIVFAGLLQQFSGQVANLSNLANNIQESLSGARRVFEVLDTPAEIRSQSNAIRLPRVQGAVQFDRVSFGYAPTDLVLNDVSFDVRPGQCIAILGATGSGKSTLMSLIPRFYDPLKGRVLIDGADARTLDVNELRRHVGIVFQDSFLFSNTLAANIAFGNPDATDEQIERAARIASAHEFITGLSAGYGTILGEGGADLSGGQRQRIAIARAILLEPSILLLDDPTAAIDPETEQEIMEAMNNAMRDRTTFVVAHRLSTLRRADRIMVLERGRIVQMGTHEELMNMPGPYRGVALLQVVDDESLRLLEETES
jgi:ATP-binding cassette subfamily B protein